MSAVVTGGYLPSSDASLPLVVLMGYSNGASAFVPPVVEPQPTFYGPALTPAQRRRWFGDEEEEKSLVAEAIREIEQDVPADELPALEPVIEAKVEAKMPETKPARRIDQQKLVARVVREVGAEVREMRRQEQERRRIDAEDEEREALALLAGMLFTME